MDRGDDLFAKHFPGVSWDAWRVFLRALFGLSMDAGQLALFRECTGLDEPPCEAVNESLAHGRTQGRQEPRLGFDRDLSRLFEIGPLTLPRARPATCLVVAPDRKQAREIFGYARTFIADTPLLAPLIVGQTNESIELSNNITIEIATCSARTIRGRTVVAGLLDEVAYWPTDSSANPGAEVLSALRPCLGGVPGSMLLAASSPAGSRGCLWRAHQRHHGRPGPVLSWQASTLTMHPAHPRGPIEAFYAENPNAAAAEYGGEFRACSSTLIDLDALEACISDVRERPPAPGRTYHAFIDAADGRPGGNSMVLAIAHNADRVAVLDCVREVRPPFSPEKVATDFVRILRSYGLFSAQGDHHLRGLLEDVFRRHGVRYHASASSKTNLFADLVACVSARSVDLLDNDRLREQVLALEAQSMAGGHEKIGMPRARDGRALHDDLVNAAAGALARAGARRRLTVLEAMGAADEGIDPEAARARSRSRHSPTVATAPAAFSNFRGGETAACRLFATLAAAELRRESPTRRSIMRPTTQRSSTHSGPPAALSCDAAKSLHISRDALGERLRADEVFVRRCAPSAKRRWTSPESQLLKAIKAGDTASIRFTCARSAQPEGTANVRTPRRRRRHDRPSTRQKSASACGSSRRTNCWSSRPQWPRRRREPERESLARRIDVEARTKD